MTSIISLEQEVRDWFSGHKVDYMDYSDQPTTPDFGIISGNARLWLEVKEKRQRIRVENWPPVSTPQEYLFILDELTARRMMPLAPYAGIIVRDNTVWRYTFISILSIWLMPRVRVNRQTNDHHQKGKWMLDLRNGVVCNTLTGAMKAFYEYVNKADRVYELGRCAGRYVGESIPLGGEPRTDQMKQYDLMMTR